ERALLHHVLLVRRHVGVARGEVHGIARLVPVEAAHAGVGAGAHAHAAADALVVVLAHHARLRGLVGGAHRTHVHAGGVLAMLAAHRHVTHAHVGVRTRGRVHGVPALGQGTRPENAFGNVVGHFAGNRAGVAANAAPRVYRHAIV